MSNKVIYLQAGSAISSYRLSELNKKSSFSKCKIHSVTKVYVLNINDDAFFVLKRIKQILNASVFSCCVDNATLFIGPRLGTISPWSTKASDILKNCGFHAVKRIEFIKCIRFDGNVEIKTAIKFGIHDRMMESIYTHEHALNSLFLSQKPQPSTPLMRLDKPLDFDKIDKELGLSLSDSEKNYLISQYKTINKKPTETELMMFAQANSEHCRHKIFNAEWTIDGIKQKKSLFQMIRNTEAKTSQPSVSAYKDNSAVFSGGRSQRWIVAKNNHYQYTSVDADVLIKVETHNHPTAISPFPGAATGSGGEIRDEAATGQGSRPKAGLIGFSVSHLNIPNHQQIWESDTIGKPDRIASAFEIMIEAPLGAAAFNNEFGRPNICGYFRSMEIRDSSNQYWGYHKPIMLAGGLGTINKELAIKQNTLPEDYLIVLGGPAMLIGLGGSSASSMTSGSSAESLDFASVQRGNPEMERRCQEVIDSCWTQSEHSPIRSIHDVGAGGLSNAMPELLDDAGLGGVLELRELQIDSPSMKPMEVWCNESQERYVLSIKPEKLEDFKLICHRERCPFAVLGRAKLKRNLVVTDRYFNNNPVNIPMDLLLGNTPKTYKQISSSKPLLSKLNLSGISVKQAVENILKFPTVASKKYLITISDRSVSGLVHRDQMVGPWQVPVADCGVTLRDYDSTHGEALSIGEKAPLALISGSASARMAVSEALMNIAANDIGALSNIKLSANWMAASGTGREDQVLFEAVKAIGEELCPSLDIGIPVGKDSLSMKSQWNDGHQEKQVVSPVSLLLSAFTNVKDVNKSITPYFNREYKHVVYYLDLAAGKKRMGASSLAQVYNQIGESAPDLDDVESLKEFWKITQSCIQSELISAYHDVSDGGIFVTLVEMCIASQTGFSVTLDYSHDDLLSILFSEELGAVVAINEENVPAFEALVKDSKLRANVHKISKTSGIKRDVLTFTSAGSEVFSESLENLQKMWSQTSHWMASLRDNPESCEQEFDQIGKDENGLVIKTEFDYNESIIAPYLNLTKPKIAILREQGINGQKEMAMAFHKAGFDCYDVHMQDLLDNSCSIMDYQGLAACGGFSYGDVLGAGKGWANSILYHQEIKQQFKLFFEDQSRFALGICNGCQMLASLKEIIPGSESWPGFEKNTSEQFEARYSSIQIENSNSLFFSGMQGAQIPVVIAHGEGRAQYSQQKQMLKANISAKYIDNKGKVTQVYPFNPNGSQASTAAISNADGNVLIMMPHPERVFRSEQMSWCSEGLRGNSPWMRMFYNARKYFK